MYMIFLTLTLRASSGSSVFRKGTIVSYGLCTGRQRCRAWVSKWRRSDGRTGGRSQMRFGRHWLPTYFIHGGKHSRIRWERGRLHSSTEHLILMADDANWSCKPFGTLLRIRSWSRGLGPYRSSVLNGDTGSLYIGVRAGSGISFVAM